MIKILVKHPKELKKGDVILFSGTKAEVHENEETNKLFVNNMSLNFVFENFQPVEVLRQN